LALFLLLGIFFIRIIFGISWNHHDFGKSTVQFSKKLILSDFISHKYFISLSNFSLTSQPTPLKINLIDFCFTSFGGQPVSPVVAAIPMILKPFFQLKLKS